MTILTIHAAEVVVQERGTVRAAIAATRREGESVVASVAPMTPAAADPTTAARDPGRDQGAPAASTRSARDRVCNEANVFDLAGAGLARRRPGGRRRSVWFGPLPPKLADGGAGKAARIRPRRPRCARCRAPNDAPEAAEGVSEEGRGLARRRVLSSILGPAGVICRASGRLRIR